VYAYLSTCPGVSDLCLREPPCVGRTRVRPLLDKVAGAPEIPNNHEPPCPNTTYFFV